MKLLRCSTAFAALCSTLSAQILQPAPPAVPKLPSSIFGWEKMKVTTTYTVIYYYTPLTPRS
jgi:hypothetical protein